MCPTMEYNLCRLCLCSGGHLMDIFEDKSAVDYAVKDTIHSLLQLEVTKESGFPWLLCFACYEKLTDFRLFKRRCIECRYVFEYRLQLDRESPSTENQPVISDKKREVASLEELVARAECDAEIDKGTDSGRDVAWDVSSGNRKYESGDTNSKPMEECMDWTVEKEENEEGLSSMERLRDGTCIVEEGEDVNEETTANGDYCQKWDTVFHIVDVSPHLDKGVLSQEMTSERDSVETADGSCELAVLETRPAGDWEHCPEDMRGVFRDRNAPDGEETLGGVRGNIGICKDKESCSLSAEGLAPKVLLTSTQSRTRREGAKGVQRATTSTSNTSSANPASCTAPRSANLPSDNGTLGKQKENTLSWSRKTFEKSFNIYRQFAFSEKGYERLLQSMHCSQHNGGVCRGGKSKGACDEMQCPKASYQLSRLERLERKTYDGSGKFLCSLCTRAFPDNESLEVHKAQHEKKRKRLARKDVRRKSPSAGPSLEDGRPQLKNGTPELCLGESSGARKETRKKRPTSQCLLSQQELSVLNLYSTQGAKGKKMFQCPNCYMRFACGCALKHHQKIHVMDLLF